tara:strand:+ start:10262 stop:11260 length:999 start_codon:yes stop_codon:yes gene_type:complete
MSAFSRFITFFNNVIVGHEKGEENNLEKALATIESTNVMDAVNAVLTNEISNYENNTIQTITSEQTIEVDCGSYRLTDWHLKERGKQYTWYGEEIPYSGCIQFGCCYDIDQKTDIKLLSNNEITKVDHEEMYSKITQTLRSEVESVVGSDDQSLKVLDIAMNETKNYSMDIIQKHIQNMNNIEGDYGQKIVIRSLSPLRCKNSCHEKPTGGRVTQFLNVDIATENIINDIIKSISETYISMTNTKKSSVSTVNVKELYLFAGFSVLLIVTLYIICYLVFFLLYLFFVKKRPPSEYITHIGAIILMIFVYLFWAMIVCIIRSGGGLSMIFCMF